MILKVKELYDKSIVLRVEDGMCSIEIQGSKGEVVNDRQYITFEKEILETYETCDYSVEEVTTKLDKIYNLLNS